MKQRICVLVVTYNRKACLLKLLPALLSQSAAIDTILIVDNASTDGTPEVLMENGYIASFREGMLSGSRKEETRILYYRNTENSGGSGGFHLGFRLALELDCDYLWAMDDDVLPEPDCLERLMAVLCPDVRLVLPSRTDDRYLDQAIVGVNMSNPFRYSIKLRKSCISSREIPGDSIPIVDIVFEGPLMAVSLIREIGLPRGDLFLIFDDSEYAWRAGQVTQLRYVKHAVLHRQILPEKTRRRRMNWKDYYGYRNQYWFDRTYGTNVFVRYLRPVLNHLDLCARAVIKGKWSNLRVLRKAYHDGTKGILGKTVSPGEQR